LEFSCDEVLPQPQIENLSKNTLYGCGSFDFVIDIVIRNPYNQMKSFEYENMDSHRERKKKDYMRFTSCCAVRDGSKIEKNMSTL
jgi:hypothetical protein